MKVITHSGGIDADGNWYDNPTVEVEVPGDAFEKAVERLFKMASRPTHFLVSETTAKALDDLS